MPRLMPRPRPSLDQDLDQGPVAQKSRKAPSTRSRLRAEGNHGHAGEGRVGKTRKPYARSAARPMFGVSFGDKRVAPTGSKVDQELAEALWDTGTSCPQSRDKGLRPANFPPRCSIPGPRLPIERLWGGYVRQSRRRAAFGNQGGEVAAKTTMRRGRPGGAQLNAMAMIDETVEDSWFLDRLHEIEETLKSPKHANRHRYVMNNALIAIGCRNAALAEAATPQRTTGHDRDRSRRHGLQDAGRGGSLENPGTDARQRALRPAEQEQAEESIGRCC